MERLTPRERWFWIGAGFACGFFVLFALTVILIGVFFARFLPVRAPSRPIVAQPGAPSSTSQIAEMRNPSPGPVGSGHSHPQKKLSPSTQEPLASGSAALERRLSLPKGAAQARHSHSHEALVRKSRATLVRDNASLPRGWGRGSAPRSPARQKPTGKKAYD